MCVLEQRPDIGAALSLSSPRYRLCLLKRCFPIQRFGPEPAGWDVIPIEVLAGPIVREADFETSASRDGLVFDDADAIRHQVHADGVFRFLSGSVWMSRRLFTALP
jgi:hypothetical protein